MKTSHGELPSFRRLFLRMYSLSSIIREDEGKRFRFLSIFKLKLPCLPQKTLSARKTKKFSLYPYSSYGIFRIFKILIYTIWNNIIFQAWLPVSFQRFRFFCNFKLPSANLESTNRTKEPIQDTIPFAKLSLKNILIFNI